MKRRFHFGYVIAVVAAVAGFGVAVMGLWNWLMPVIFGIPVINFWQALGLLALAKILCSGIRLGGPFGGGDRRMHNNAIREKWLNMNKEERREFLNRRSRFDFDHCDHDHFSRETFGTRDECDGSK